MSDKKTVIGDEMIESQLKENSNRLNISVDELIERYIRRGLYRDDYYKPPKMSQKKLLDLFNLDEEPSKKRKNHPKKSSMDSIIDIYVFPDE